MTPRGWSVAPFLLAVAVFAAGVCDAGDDPFAVDTNEIEQVGAAVVDFAVRQEFERSPHHRQIVVDPD